LNKCPTSSRQKNAKQKHTKNRVCAVCMTFLAARRRMCNHPNFFKQISEMTFSFFLSLPNHELKFTSGGQKQGQSQMPGNEVPGGDLICFIKKDFWREDVGCFVVRFNKNVLRDMNLFIFFCAQPRIKTHLRRSKRRSQIPHSPSVSCLRVARE
jgi:hypothetical protein